jgi:hypothetical protein
MHLSIFKKIIGIPIKVIFIEIKKVKKNLSPFKQSILSLPKTRI